MSDDSSVKKVLLPFWTCLFIESELDNNETTAIFPTADPETFFKCPSQGEFYFGSREKSGIGHVICIIFVICIWLIGLFGIVANILSIVLVPKSMKKLSGSLSQLLVALAIFELITAASAIGFSTCILIILENADRGEASLYALKVTYAFYTFGRVAFIYTTILVSIERYLVVTFPSKAQTLLSPVKRKLYFVVVIIIAILTDFPLIFDAAVEENVEATESLQEFPYLYRYTYIGSLMYPWFTYYGQLFIKTWIPVPLLLIFNGLLYRSINRWRQRRESLTRSQKREINAATMLMTVVLLVMFWNMPYYLSFITEFIVQSKHAYRESQFLKIFCITSSTTVNFLMYFRNSQVFKIEVLKYLGLTSEHREKNQEGLSVTGNSV